MIRSLLLYSLLLALPHPFASTPIAQTEEFAAKHSLRRMVFDPVNSRFYLGGTNALYQLDWHLRVASELETGPRLDSPQCHASGCAKDNVSKVLTDNVNKLLVLDRENARLIACGSLFQGACQRLSLSDIAVQPEFIAEPIAANDANSSTFAFIGPQRYNRWGHGDVLYVGTTFTSAGDFRHDVPAISSRNLHDLKFAEYSFSKQSLLRIDVKYRDRYLVDYVYGFNTTRHVYFATVQKKSHSAGHEERGYLSRLARVCVSDANFDTYVEITLQCKSHGEVYGVLSKAVTAVQADGSVVLLGTFQKEMESRESVICSYPLSMIEQSFDQNIHECFNGSMVHRNLDYISGPVYEGRCPDAGSTGNILDFCEVGLKLSGRHPLIQESLVILPNRVSSLHYALSPETLLTIVGTHEGSIFVLNLFEDAYPVRIREVNIGSPVLDVIAHRNALVYLHENKITKVPLAECEQHRSCDECHAARNPLCGWCSKKNKCSVTEDCKAEGWLLPSSQCLRLLETVPKFVSGSSPSEPIHLRLNLAPRLDSQDRLECVYAEGSRKFPVRHVNDGLVCPNPFSRPGFRPRGETVALKVVYGGEGTPLLSTQLTVFNCQNQTSCKSCLSFESCKWCPGSDTCSSANSAADCLANESQCPAIVSQNLEVPDNELYRMRLGLKNSVGLLRGPSSFYCMVAIEGATMKVAAQLRGDVVICDETRYVYKAENATIDATVSVVGAVSGFVLDSVPFTIFKCGQLGSQRGIPDCSVCLSHSQHYGCSWCNGGCNLNSQCGGVTTRTCPKPEVVFVQPISGPVEGGTLLKIEGSNLFSDGPNPKYMIRVGGKPCGPLKSDQDGLSCVSPRVADPENVTVDIVDGGEVFKSKVVFQYKDFSVRGASPNRGPLSGGTLLTLTGLNLDIGFKRKIFLDNIPCLEVKEHRTRERLTCRIQRAGKLFVSRRLLLEIDNGRREIPFNFAFEEDPVVRHIKPLESYYSGGRTITFHGNNFDLVDQFQMLLYVNHDVTLVTPCQILSSRYMECLTPSILPFLNSTSTETPKVDIGVRGANLSSLLHLRSSFPSLQSTILFVPDPYYKNFSRGVKIYKGDELVLEGERLVSASDKSSIAVEIGNDYCNITSITNTHLVCMPPAYLLESQQALVKVKVGENLVYKLGYVQYFLSTTPNLVSPELIGGISAVAVVLTFIAVVAVIFLKHKSSEKEREYKRIQIQMDLLENNVRAECKQAFAELQTDMTDLTMELETTGIPVRTKKEFLMRTLFPGVHDHILNSGHSKRDAASQPLVQLHHLLMNERFLVTFVRHVESRPSFTYKDRVNFASLISIVLSCDMVYFTQIVRIFLLDSAERARLERDTHPTLSPGRGPVGYDRNCQEISEKLVTNWLSICLFDYVKDYVGPSLFLLYRALKCQLEKGPVDMFSHESRYSLTEDGLLHRTHDFSSVICLVLQRELEEAYEARVLDCDSISQVKAKILDTVYKNTPFSMRPNRDEVDLEWQCGQESHVILQDFDLTSKEVNSVSRVNTLRHYGIKTKAVVSLVPKVYPKNGMSPHSSTTNSSSSSRVFHLTFPDDPIERSTGGKDIPEVFLTRLLSTKGTINKFVDDFFHSILTVQSRFPCVIKWLFDLVEPEENIYADAFASSSPVPPPTSSLSSAIYMKFWQTFLKSPPAFFDVEENAPVSRSLSVISQALVSASLHDPTDSQRFNSTSPTPKLLFAKEIKEQQTRMTNFVQDVRRLPSISEEEMNFHLQQLSQQNSGLFDVLLATNELLLYVERYDEDLLRLFLANREFDLAKSLEMLSRSVGGKL